jgi:phosphohistidine phosphatase
VKRLLLLRHAKSCWDDPSLEDHERPLAPRGHRACKVIAEHLRSEGLSPELVLCSWSRRTRETLDAIAPSFAGPVDVRLERGLYESTASEILDRLRRVNDDVASVMVIGHHPAIQDLALILSRGGPIADQVERKFPTAALATLTFEGEWRDLVPGGAELVAFVKPKELAVSGRP